MVGIKLTRGSTGRATAWETDAPSDVGNQVHQLTGVIDPLVHSGRFDNPVQAVKHLIGAPRVHAELITTLLSIDAAEAAKRVAGAVEGYTKLISELRGVTPAILAGTLFRAREADSHNPPIDFGVPPNQQSHRFNGRGEKALYLARSETVLRAELSQSGACGDLWVQRFELTARGLKLIKLDPNSCASYPALNQFVIMSERHVDPAHTHAHIGTQLLRAICVSVGFDAIEYPTVTGAFSSDPSATNIAALSLDAIDACITAKVGAPYLLSS